MNSPNPVTINSIFTLPVNFRQGAKTYVLWSPYDEDQQEPQPFDSAPEAFINFVAQAGNVIAGCRRGTLELLLEKPGRPPRYLALMRVEVLPEPVCRECGCSHYDPCPQGCGWANPGSLPGDLCTACSEGEGDAAGEATNLGPCCACERMENVRTIVQLDFLCPILGRGWGNLEIDMEPIAAMAVVCDRCVEAWPDGDPIGPLKYACTGYPARDGRTPIGELQPLPDELREALKALAEDELR